MLVDMSDFYHYTASQTRNVTIKMQTVFYY
jgi:hypothetical protein